MILSVIIPIYNAEKYLQGCLESVYQQNLDQEDFEVIAINDGSIDGSFSILNAFQEKYSNLKIINTENKGVANARNLGLDIANGSYITFIDSDDQIFPDTLNFILKKLDRDNSDILYPIIYFYDQDNNFIEKSKIENEKKVLKGIHQERRTLPATFYRKETINNNRFPNNVIVGEDTVFNASVQSWAERVTFYELPYYRYLVRHNSLSKKAITEEGYQGFVNAIKILDDFKRNNFSDDDLGAKNYFDKVILIFLTRIVEFHILPNLYKPKYLEIKKLLTDLGYWHLTKKIAEKYPYFDTSFARFTIYQKKLNFKTKIYHIIHKLKP